MKAPIGKFKFAALLVALAPLSMAHACEARSPSFSDNGHVFSVNLTCTHNNGHYVLTSVTLGNHKGTQLIATSNISHWTVGPVSAGMSKTKSLSDGFSIDSDGEIFVEIHKYAGNAKVGTIDCDLDNGHCVFRP